MYLSCCKSPYLILWFLCIAVCCLGEPSYRMIEDLSCTAIYQMLAITAFMLGVKPPRMGFDVEVGSIKALL
jgi:hypothetical protein